MPGFFHGDGRAALTRAVVAFEAATAAELVISVRARSDAYLLASVVVGALVALALTAFLLYGEPAFDLHWFLILPLLAGVSAGLLARLPPLQRLLVRRKTRSARVTRAARALFVERSVADTRGRTGVLLYVGVSERRAVVLADLGVRRAAPAEPWARATAAIDQAVARGEPASALPPLILALADLCSDCLPRQDDDENELSDEVDS